jgi:hypothetical protein
MDSRDREVLRSLASRWREWASLPVMEERKRLWTALKDLRAERPMVLFETWTLEEYVAEAELECQDPLFRSVERQMRWTLRQAEEVGDDLVIEPCWRVGWEIQGTGYGVAIRSQHAVDGEGGHVAYAFDHPIRTPDDIDRLRPRTWQVDREKTRQRWERLADAFGDILPVVPHGTTGLHAGLTQDLFKLIGNDNLMTWTYDAPQALHRLMAYLRDDRLAYFDWLEREGLLGLNNNSTLVGSGSPGFTTSLPQPGYAGPPRLRDLWVWMESQETVGISPAMFEEFFLPYMAEVAGRFGLVYYGCCEPVHDRWDRVRKAMPHVRAVSISPWCDKQAMAEKLGQSCVFSRKPRPAPISGSAPDWDTLRQDLDETLAAARGCNLEILFRDVYRIGGDRARLRQWVEMVRDRIERGVAA